MTRTVAVTVTRRRLHRRDADRGWEQRSNVDLTYRWRLLGDELELTVELTPSTGWTAPGPEQACVSIYRRRSTTPSGLGRSVGVLSRLRHPALVGRFAAGIGELNVRYSRPQETGHRADLRWLTVSAAGRPVLHVAAPGRGRRPPAGFHPHPLDAPPLNRARHPHELGGP